MNATTPNPPAKARIYESLYRLNQGFEISLFSLEQLEQLGIFEADELRALKIALEHTRAQANEEITEALQQYEGEQAVGFEQMEREREKRFKDPDDVFLRQQIAKMKSANKSRLCKKVLPAKRAALNGTASGSRPKHQNWSPFDEEILLT
jgi:hypothetical protein